MNKKLRKIKFIRSILRKDKSFMKRLKKKKYLFLSFSINFI